MVRHIVMWNQPENGNPAEQRENAIQVKEGLEALKNSIPGIIDLKVYIDALPTGNRRVVLNSLFESPEALASYQVHPDHLRVSAFVGSLLCDRACIDYYE